MNTVTFTASPPPTCPVASSSSAKFLNSPSIVIHYIILCLCIAPPTTGYGWQFAGHGNAKVVLSENRKPIIINLTLGEIIQDNCCSTLKFSRLIGRCTWENQGKHLVVNILVFLQEKTEHNPVNLLIIVLLFQPLPDSPESNTAGRSVGVAVNTSGDAGEGNATQTVVA